MPQENQDGWPWPATLTERIGHDAGPEQVADAVAAIWSEVDQALHPIIGHRGVAALYNRSLHLSSAAHPWLPRSRDGLLAAVDVSALQAALRQQTAAAAGAGAAALFQSFHALLASLVGTALTDQLLATVWASPPRATPAQESSS